MASTETIDTPPEIMDGVSGEPTPDVDEDVEEGDAEKLIEALRKENEEAFSFARSNFQHFVTWFTFFVNVNFVVFGFCVSGGGDPSRLKRVVPAAALYFIVQTTLGTATCGMFLVYAHGVSQRGTQVLQQIATLIRVKPSDLNSPFPYAFVRNVVTNMVVALLVLLVLWGWLLRNNASWLNPASPTVAPVSASQPSHSVR